MKTMMRYFSKNGSGWKWLQESLYVFALALPLAATILR